MFRRAGRIRVSAKARNLAASLTILSDRVPASDSVPAQFAQPLPARALSRYAALRGKASRFLARNVAREKLAMCNTVPLVSFTFDDAPETACVEGARLLERYQARGTYYISGGGCGEISPGGRLATAAQISSLAANRHEIGCHTYQHTAVSATDTDALGAELERNRHFLQSLGGGIVVRNFAYPYGDLSFGAKRYLETQFDSCRSLLPGLNAGSADLGALKVCELQNSTIDRRGVRDVVVETVRRTGWLIFVSHDVGERPSRFGISPDLLEFALESARAAGCRLVTVQDALRLSNTPAESRFNFQ